MTPRARSSAHAPAGAVAALTDTAIGQAVAALTGEITQVPATVSAIKVDGRRAYARARAGEDVVLAARPVTVSRFEITAVRRELGRMVPVRSSSSTSPSNAPPGRTSGPWLAIWAPPWGSVGT